MKRIQRGAASGAVLLGTVTLMGIGLAGPASAAAAVPAAPYVCQIQVGVVFGSDVRQVSVKVNCATPGELVEVSVVTSLADGPVAAAQSRQIGLLRADANGVAQGTLGLPSGTQCEATIHAKGRQSGRTASTKVNVEPCDSSGGVPSAAGAQAGGDANSVTVDPSSIVGDLDPATTAEGLVDVAGVGARPGLASSPTTSSQQKEEFELLAAELPAGPTSGPISQGAAAAGLGVILAGAAAGMVVARRREGRNSF